MDVRSFTQIHKFIICSVSAGTSDAASQTYGEASGTSRVSSNTAMQISQPSAD